MIRIFIARSVNTAFLGQNWPPCSGWGFYKKKIGNLKKTFRVAVSCKIISVGGFFFLKLGLSGNRRSSFKKTPNAFHSPHLTSYVGVFYPDRVFFPSKHFFSFVFYVYFHVSKYYCGFIFPSNGS